MKLYKSYFKEFIELFPTLQDNLQLKEYKYLQKHYENSLSIEHVENQKKLYNKYLILLKNKKLDHYGKVLKQTLEIYLDAFKTNLDLMPLEHMDNPIPFFCEDASGNLFYKFKTHQDYYDFLNKTREFKEYINSCIEKMREGIKKKITLPKILAEKLLEQIKGIKKTKPYKNNNVPKNLKFNFNIEIEYHIDNMLKNLIFFLENEYIKNCRQTFGLSQLKDGKKMYKYLIKSYTSLDIDPLEIHQYGLEEVTRIHKEMLIIKDKLGFKDNLDKFNEYLINRKDLKFKSGDEVLKTYRNELKKINNTVIKNQFKDKISHECLIVRVPKFNEDYAAGAYYIAGSVDGSRKGKYYMNLKKIDELTKMDVRSLTLHEANPGHHFQLTHMLDKDHPLFIKSTTLAETGYVEGWGLYCENLGEYESLESLYGKLNMEMARALRLVIDTGIHYFNWSIKKSLNFMKKYQFESENKLLDHIFRYMAIPGQALTYKLGERIFLNLKKKYVEKGNMNIKDFHYKCLRFGNMPINLLEKSFEY